MRRMTDLGSWLLRKMARGPYAEAVAGDLMESVRGGRSAGWYWRQVMAAIGSAWVAKARANAGAMMFAVLWSALYPLWWLAMQRVLLWSMGSEWWQVGYPYLIPVTAGYWALLEVTFAWIGLLLYLAVNRERWVSGRFLYGWSVSLSVFFIGKLALSCTLHRVIGRNYLVANGLMDGSFLWVSGLMALSLFCAMLAARPRVRRVVAAG